MMMAASNVGPYGLFWQPALVCHTLILYMSLFIGQIKMLACLLDDDDILFAIAKFLLKAIL